MSEQTGEIVCGSFPAPPPVGPLLVAVSPAGVCRLEFGEDMPAFLASLSARGGGTRVAECADLPEPIVRQFADYFAGRRRSLALPLDRRFMTPFQRTVFDILLDVPAGQVVTYRQLAHAVGRPSASRGVGSAMAHNPVPIVVPCHRVIRSDGTLAGYSAGVRVKEYLLSLEGTLLPLRNRTDEAAAKTGKRTGRGDGEQHPEGLAG